MPKVRSILCAHDFDAKSVQYFTFLIPCIPDPFCIIFHVIIFLFFFVHLKYSKPDSSALCHRSRMTQCLISYLPTRFCLFCPDGPFARPARIVVCKARDDIQQSIIYRTNFELSSPGWIDIDTGRTRLGFGTSGPVLGTTVNHEMIQIKGSTVN